MTGVSANWPAPARLGHHLPRWSGRPCTGWPRRQPRQQPTCSDFPHTKITRSRRGTHDGNVDWLSQQVVAGRAQLGPEPAEFG